MTGKPLSKLTELLYGCKFSTHVAIHRVSLVLESDLSFCPAHGLVLVSEPRLPHQHKHRYECVHRHGNPRVCRRPDHLEVGCPTANDIRRSCVGCVSHGQRNRWLRRCANSPRRNEVPRIDRNDHGCRFDRPKGLHNTGAVAV